MISDIKILIHQGKQYIPDITTAVVPGIFRGRPVISNEKTNVNQLVELCPTGAISPDPLRIDLENAYSVASASLLSLPGSALPKTIKWLPVHAKT